jgi:thiamine-monophosphate kinase
MSTNEFNIIERHFKNKSKFCNNILTGIGDDAAILKLKEGQHLAVSTDTLVNGIHFSKNTSAYDIGYKSLAVNLSDMAAMGAEPLWATLSLTLPDKNESWITDFTKGFFNLANKYNVALVGGDLTHGPLSITVQIIGSIPSGIALCRDRAVVDENIYVTGVLGMASLALSILTGEISGQNKPTQECLIRLNRPDPRVNIGLSLRGLASAAIDISDGLAADLGHILSGSSVGAEIILDNIPIYNKLDNIEYSKMLSYGLNRGDDYELCFTANKKHHDDINIISNQNNCEITCIGKITNGSQLIWKTITGEKVDIESGGYQHF